MRTGLIAAFAILAIAGGGTAFAGDGDKSVPNGYVFPNFEDQAPAQRAPASMMPEHRTGSSTSTYTTQSVPTNPGIYLFPPARNGNG